MADLTPQTWAATLLKRLGIQQTPGAVQGLVGWAQAEGGNWNNDARFNPLNTTQGAKGARPINSVGVKSYGSWDQGLEATVQTLRNGRYGVILKALQAGDPSQLASAIGKTPWGTNAALARQTISRAAKVKGVKADSSLAGGGAAPAVEQQQPVSAGAAPATTLGDQGADVAGFLSQLLAGQKQQQAAPAASTLQAPAFAAAAPTPGGYAGAPSGQGGGGGQGGLAQALSAAMALQGDATGLGTSPGGAPATQPAAAGAPPAAGAQAGQRRGKVVIAKNANRAGVSMQKPVLGFLDDVSASAGRPIEVGTGTNHNRMTTSGNVSDHWDGNAGDLPVGGDARQDASAGKKGDLIAAHALQVAYARAKKPIGFAQAYKMARKGGLWNIETPQGRVQVIWRSLVGGNHYDHVHAGLNPAR